MSAMQRIEIVREGSVAVLDYVLDANSLSILHVETPFALRGRGIAGELVEEARALAGEKQVKLIPICRFAKSYLARYPQPKSRQ